MKETEIDRRVDAVLSASRQVTTRAKRSHTKGLLKRSPFALILMVVGISGAVLLGSLFSVFFVSMKGDVELIGNPQPLFAWDGTPFTTEMLSVPLDITTISAGQVGDAPHEIENRDNGAWKITFNTENVTFTDPMDPYYGFYFSISDFTVNYEPVAAENLIICPGDIAGFTFNYALDPEFVDIEVPLDFDVTVKIERFDLQAPVGVDDGPVVVIINHPVLVDVLQNDIDPQQLPLFVSGASENMTGFYDLAIINNKILVTSVYGGFCDGLVATYFVSNGYLETEVNLLITLDT
jgi:hypothetical protein